MSYTNMAFKQTMGTAPYDYLTVQPNDRLTYSANEVLHPGTKFAIEHAFSNLVHIRSCLNNKYWVRSDEKGFTKNWIVAQAVKPVVDQTSPGCTLFSINMQDNNKRATFYHVESGRVVCHPVGQDGVPLTVLSVDPTATTEAVSDVVDYDGLMVLPKFVAFKGSNGLYYKNSEFPSFVEKEIGSPLIVCHTHYSPDGHLRISDASKRPMFWSAAGGNPTGPALIVYDNDFPTNVEQMFDIIKVDKNVIALRSRYNNLICIRADYPQSSGPKDRLVAKSTGMVNDAHLEIIEPVYNRKVTVYEFNLDRARIYGQELLYSDEHIWDNYTDVAQSGSANGTISTTKTRTYTNTVTLSATVKTTFETGIPFIAKGKIEVSATAAYAHEWSNTTTEEQQVGHVFNVSIPPKKRTIARGTATKAKCDVPFFYTQRDYPSDGGPPRVTTLKDGVFTGANAYNFHSEVRYDELPTALNGPAPTECIKSVEPCKA